MPEVSAEHSGVPNGFVPFEHRSSFLDRAIGAVYERTVDGRLVVGLRVGDAHLNSWGAAHGGLLCTLVDVALGQAIARTADRTHPALVDLDVTFLAPAPAGSWVEVRTSVSRAGSRLGFARADVHADDRPVAQASGVFAMRPA